MKSRILYLSLLACISLTPLNAQETPAKLTNLDFGENGQTIIGSIYGFDGKLIASTSQNEPGDGDGDAPYFLINPETGERTNLLAPDPAITEHTENQRRGVREFFERDGDLYVFRNEAPTAIYKLEGDELTTFVQGDQLQYANMRFLDGVAYIIAGDGNSGNISVIRSDGTEAGTRVLATTPSDSDRFNSATVQLEVDANGLVFAVATNSNTEYLYRYSFADESIAPVELDGTPIESLQIGKKTLGYSGGNYYYSAYNFDLSTYDFLEINGETFAATRRTVPFSDGSSVRFYSTEMLDFEDELLIQFSPSGSGNREAVITRVAGDGSIEPITSEFTVYQSVAPPFVTEGTAYFPMESPSFAFSVQAYSGDTLAGVFSYPNDNGNFSDYGIYPAENLIYVAGFNADGNNEFSSYDTDANQWVGTPVTLDDDDLRGEAGGAVTTVGDDLIYLALEDELMYRWDAPAAPEVLVSDIPFDAGNATDPLRLLGVDPASGDLLVDLDSHPFAVAADGMLTALDAELNYDTPLRTFAAGGRLLIDIEQEELFGYADGAYQTLTYTIPSRSFTGTLPGLNIIAKFAGDLFLVSLPEDLADETDVDEGILTVGEGTLSLELLPVTEGYVDYVQGADADRNSYLIAISYDQAMDVYQNTILDATGSILFKADTDREFRLLGADDMYFYLGSRQSGGEPTVVLIYDRSGDLVDTVMLPEGQIQYEAAVNGAILMEIEDQDTRETPLYLVDGATGTSSVVPGVVGVGSFEEDLDKLGFPIQGRVVFPARTADNGAELYVSDGTLMGTNLLADINPGSGDSDPDYFRAKDGYIFFSADGPAGRELYRVTPGGVVSLLADVFPGVRSSSPKDLFFLGEDLYFSARSSDDNFYEVFRLPIDFSTSTETFAATPPNIYPNPIGAGPLTIEAPADEQISEVEVFTADGRRVVARKFSPSASVSLNLAGLATGQYWVRTRYEDGRVSLSGLVR